MAKTITIALKTDGTSYLVHGPEVPTSEQKQTVQKYREEGTPEGVERVEIWPRPTLCVKFAYRKAPVPAPESSAPPAEDPEPLAPEQTEEPQPEGSQELAPHSPAQVLTGNSAPQPPKPTTPPKARTPRSPAS